MKFFVFFNQDASQPGAIYIITAQYDHSGRYDCVSKTTQDEISAGAILAVEGEKHFFSLFYMYFKIYCFNLHLPLYQFKKQLGIYLMGFSRVSV